MMPSTVTPPFLMTVMFPHFMSGSSSQRRTKSESEMKLYSLDVHADLKATPIDDSSPPPPDEPPNDKKIPEVQLPVALVLVRFCMYNYI